tara:strand:- start:17107 stop:21006 length:3900 start_codon:yes stop_codon:yes gene_type:complete
MGVYSRKLQKYNLLKDFRVSNGTTWKLSRSLVFWLRANSSTNLLVDQSNNLSPIASTGTGHLDTTKGPLARFNFNGLNFNTKYITVSNGEAEDVTNEKSIVFSGWIYLNVSPGLNNQGFSILQTDAVNGFNIFVDDQGRLGIRLTNYSDSTHDGGGSALASSTIKTDMGVVFERKWVHFAIAIDKSVATQTIFAANATKPRIFINGHEEGTTHTDVGSPSLLDPKTAAGSYRIGYGPAKDETVAKIYLNGALADLALFQPDVDLTDAQLASLYYAALNGAYLLGSGFISTSPFNVLNDAMHRDTHPTVARHSNDRRQGNHNIHFDDSRAIHLTNSAATSFPTMLSEENPLFNTVYNGIENGQLTSTAVSASFGIFDEYYEENNAVTIEPFIESKIYLNSGSSYYSTGTLESEIPGFNQPLRNKEIISIELQNEADIILGSYGDSEIIVDNGQVNQPSYMAYWDNGNSLFRSLPGNTITVVNAAEFNTSALRASGTMRNHTGSCIGFASPLQILSGTGQIPYSSDDYSGITITKFPENYYKTFGNPIDYYGFPDDRRYESRDGESINMSNYISKPFLLEKIAFEFSELKINPCSNHQAGTHGTTFTMGINMPVGGSPQRHAILEATRGIELLTCFLMREFPSKVSTSTESQWHVPLHSIRPISTSSFFSGDTNRDLVTYSQALFYNTSNDNTIKSFFARNLSSLYQVTSSAPGLTDFNNQSGYDDIANLIQELMPFEYKENLGQEASSDGSFAHVGDAGAVTRNDLVIESVPKIIRPTTFGGQITGNAAHVETTSAGTLTLSYSGQATNKSEIATNRNYSTGLAGLSNPENAFLIVGAGNVGEHISVEISESEENTSPQILLPSDKLIFGLQTLPRISERFAGTSGVNILAGSRVKITLFGSYIRNEKRSSNGYGQNLGTHTVHESIGSDAVSDQFITAYIGEYSGSFSDDVISGSIDPTTVYEGHDHVTGEIIKLARRVGGRATQGTQGETGALRINNRLVDNNERQYDSIMPDFAFITNIDDAHFGQLASEKLATLGLLKFGNISAGANAHWFYSYPFEGRYAGAARTHTITKPDGSTQASYRMEFADTAAGTNFISFSNTGTILTGSTGFSPRNTVESLAVNNQGTLNQFIEAGDVIRVLFAAGDLSRGRFFAIGADSDGDRVGVNSANSGATINFGGYKYGVSNSRPAFSSAVYSRSAYGQLRDMLEPRKFTAYFKDGVVSFPVEQRFFTRNNQPLNESQRINTTCSNLSTNATSSLPFFDRENNESARNRDAGSTVTQVNISPNFAPAQGPFTGL